MTSHHRADTCHNISCPSHGAQNRRKFLDYQEPEFEVHITVDHTARVRALDDEDAASKVWDQITNSGAWNLEVTEIGGDDAL